MKSEKAASDLIFNVAFADITKINVDDFVVRQLIFFLTPN